MLNSIIFLAHSVREVSVSALGGNPEAPENIDDTTVGPGLIGFLATLFVALMTIFLVVNMSRRLRRLRVRAEAEEAQQRAQEEAAPTRAADAEPGDPEVGGADTADPARTDPGTGARGQPEAESHTPENSASDTELGNGTGSDSDAKGMREP